MAKAHVPMPKPGYSLHYFVGKGYAILDPRGVVISGYRYNSALLQDRLDRLQAEHDARMKRGPRPCMACGDTFKSEGIHNRLCDACRQRGMAPDPLASGYRRLREGRAA